MLVQVAQHIGQRAPHLRGRAEDVRVIPVGDDGAPSLHHAVQLLGDAHREPLHTPRQRLRVLGLDDQVDVIALHRKLVEPKAKLLLAGDERLANGPKAPLAAQVPNLAPHTHRHMHRQLPQRRPPQVRHPGLLAVLRLPPRAFALAATALQVELQLRV